MISASAIGGIAAVSFGMVMTPGPNMIYVVSRSVSQGRRAGMISLGGVVLGFLTYLTAAVAGLSALFALVPTAYLALKLVGAGYLLWLAWRAFRSPAHSPFRAAEMAHERPLKLFGMGVLTCLLNPKLAILYITLLPQFVEPAKGRVALQSAVLGLTQITVGTLGNAAFVLTAGALAGFLARRPLLQRLHGWATGTLLAGFAVRIATERGRAAVA
ncbi:threonine/homoserine/homoserine lactone efflux protein [Streptomyces sp. TLI_235]|nr:LysE family translocator [Streptomyces sp. TLI_235]PBC66192.1 threonine/homoserine/homoserine lactone efflux protein [Streptomyces sp. TLI_235]